MRLRLLSRATLLAGSFTAVLLSGCVVAPLGYQQPYYGGPDVMLAPPQPQTEVIGVAPTPGWFWINGFWGWGGGGHVWHPGRWEQPRAGYRWAPHQWTPHGRGWREAPGHWERR